MSVHHPPSNRDRHPTPTLSTEVERLERTSNSEDLDGATQAKIQDLIAHLKTQLRQHHLSRPVQQELALLLSLLSNIDRHQTHLIEIAALAITVLLDSGEPPNSSVIGKLSRSPNHNLAFVRQTRLQLARQIEEHPHPIRAIFAGAGGAYNRLISGLSWFFVIFVLSPILSMGAVLLIFNLMSGNQFRELAQSQLQTLQTIDSRLEGTQQELQKARDNRNTLDTELVRTIDILSESTDVTSGVREIPTSPVAPPAQSTVAAPTSPAASLNSAPAVEPDPSISQRRQNAIDRINQAREVSRRGAAIQESVSATIQTIRTQDIRSALAAAESIFMEDLEASDVGDVEQGPRPQAMPAPNDTGNVSQATPSTEADPNRAAAQQVLIKLLNLDISSFILVLSMGALGSAVSVIVRAKQFIEQSDGHADLFFVGFFRPIVGMTFAIFAIAIIQSGVSLNIISFGSPTRSDSQPNTQLYIVIAFIAGFSERLIKDVVGKTEDTLAGPTSRSLPAERE